MHQSARQEVMQEQSISGGTLHSNINLLAMSFDAKDLAAEQHDPLQLLFSKHGIYPYSIFYHHRSNYSQRMSKKYFTNIYKLYILHTVYL